MRVLVTGGSGFIGRHLLPLLVREGHEVLCLSRGTVMHSGMQILQGDLYEPNSYRVQLENFRPTCAIHLAWGGLPDYSLGNCHRNLLAGIKLFELLERVGCKRIFTAGTCWEYGKLTGAVKEIDQGEEIGMFAAFKIALNAIGQSICKANGCRFIWGRPFFVYGPGQRVSSLIPSVYQSLSAGSALLIDNPMLINDFIHVFDVAEAIIALVESNEAVGIYNIGTGTPVAVWEVVNAVARCLCLPPVYFDMPSLSETGLWADIGRMKALGWWPAMTLEAGIAQTIETWKKQKN